MKCTGISVGNSSEGNRTLEQFIQSKLARSPLGQLFLALTFEKEWSSKYTVYASFGNEPCLIIGHQDFLPDRPFIIKGKKAYRPLTVRLVEAAIRAHLRDSREAVHLSVNILKEKIEKINEVLNRIDEDKAIGAINAAFLATVGIQLVLIPTLTNDLYSFYEDDQGPIFIARKIDGEFIGGVARIDCSILSWCREEDGILHNQRYGIFWIALAKAFVIHELKLLKDVMYCRSISASENPGDDDCRYTVEKVIMGMEGRDVVVTFENDLPASVIVVDPE